MQAVCASETWIYLHVSYKRNAFDDFSFQFFVREFSNCNIMFVKACATTQLYSVARTFSTLMSGDVQTIETIYLTFLRITWTVKSSQVWRHLINLESSWRKHFNSWGIFRNLRTAIFQNENTKVSHSSKINIQYLVDNDVL